MKIKDREISTDSLCYLIAEAGVNHNGSLQTAKRLIDVAVDSGADAVKFQSFNVSDLILRSVEKASYQKVTTDPGESQSSMLKKLEIDKEFHLELIDYCEKKGIQFLSTPYDVKSLELLVSLNMPAIKIASTDTTNLLFLEKVARTRIPVILSTGMCYLSEIEEAYSVLKNNGCEDLAILRCTSNYPTPVNEVNLKTLFTIRERFPDVLIGFSDHTEGIGASPYAVACGAKIIEKHFTLDKKMAGPDHKASLSPGELCQWVKEIRNVETMMGSRNIQPTASEAETKKMLQKSLVANIGIKKGEYLSRENVSAKRTGGTGIPADQVYSLLGKKALMDIKPDTVILKEMFG